MFKGAKNMTAICPYCFIPAILTITIASVGKAPMVLEN